MSWLQLVSFLSTVSCLIEDTNKLFCESLMSIKLWTLIFLYSISPLIPFLPAALCWDPGKPSHHVGTGLLFGQPSVSGREPQCFGVTESPIRGGVFRRWSGHGAPDHSLVSNGLWELAGASHRTGRRVESVAWVPLLPGAPKSLNQLWHPPPPTHVQPRCPSTSEPARPLSWRGLDFGRWSRNVRGGWRFSGQSQCDEATPGRSDRAEGHCQSPPGA